MIKADWGYVIGQATRALRARGGELRQPGPTTIMPCEVVLTCKPGSNGKILLVRCRCQAQTQDTPRERYFNYDTLGEASSLAAAIALWKEHTG
jgi:hypothetical protein